MLRFERSIFRFWASCYAATLAEVRLRKSTSVYSAFSTRGIFRSWSKFLTMPSEETSTVVLAPARLCYGWHVTSLIVCAAAAELTLAGVRSSERAPEFWKRGNMEGDEEDARRPHIFWLPLASLAISHFSDCSARSKKKKNCESCPASEMKLYLLHHRKSLPKWPVALPRSWSRFWEHRQDMQSQINSVSCRSKTTQSERSKRRKRISAAERNQQKMEREVKGTDKGQGRTSLMFDTTDKTMHRSVLARSIENRVSFSVWESELQVGAD